MAMFQTRSAGRGIRLGGRSANESARARPVLVRNPVGDREFDDFIDLLMLSGHLTPSDLTTALRTRYPRAIVRRRDLDEEFVEIWYVYREGHWIGRETHVGR
jgi:hypothetical protein